MIEVILVLVSKKYQLWSLESDFSAWHIVTPVEFGHIKKINFSNFRERY